MPGGALTRSRRDLRTEEGSRSGPPGLRSPLTAGRPTLLLPGTEGFRSTPSWGSLVVPGPTLPDPGPSPTPSTPAPLSAEGPQSPLPPETRLPESLLTVPDFQPVSQGPAVCDPVSLPKRHWGLGCKTKFPPVSSGPGPTGPLTRLSGLLPTPDSGPPETRGGPAPTCRGTPDRVRPLPASDTGRGAVRTTGLAKRPGDTPRTPLPDNRKTLPGPHPSAACVRRTPLTREGQKSPRPERRRLHLCPRRRRARRGPTRDTGTGLPGCTRVVGIRGLGSGFVTTGLKRGCRPVVGREGIVEGGSPSPVRPPESPASSLQVPTLAILPSVPCTETRVETRAVRGGGREGEVRAEGERTSWSRRYQILGSG